MRRSRQNGEAWAQLKDDLGGRHNPSRKTHHPTGVSCYLPSRLAPTLIADQLHAHTAGCRQGRASSLWAS